MAQVSEALKKLIEPTVVALGYELWGVVATHQSGRYTVCVYIEQQGGVSFADCERVSRQVSSVLDAEDLIHHAYVLEVSSPGLDRLLLEKSHFERYVGKTINVKFYEAVDQRLKLKGVIEAVEPNGDIVLKTQEKSYRFSLTQLKSARVVF